MSFLVSAARSKGLLTFVRRFRSILARYGLTSNKMEQSLRLFAEVLAQFECGASFPITAVAVSRNPQVILPYLGGWIEFAVHGYQHVDYSNLNLEEQRSHLQHAQRIFADVGVPAAGFRSPYLRSNDTLYTAIKETGFSYVSNQPILWNVLGDVDLERSASDSYQRALAFYAPWCAEDKLSLPSCKDGLVEIPVSLPDDEILLDRLQGDPDGLVPLAWRRMLREVFQRGELFVLQLHPERITLALQGLISVLEEARDLTPPVWMARLDQIAAWWKARLKAPVMVIDGEGEIKISVTGPEGLTWLVRGITSNVETVSWKGDYRKLSANSFTIYTSLRPFVGLAPDVPGEVAYFLREQGYIVETSREPQRYACYLDKDRVVSLDSPRAIIDRIEKGSYSLVKLGYWPNGAGCALSITGDIDALTLWDYGLRFLGR